MLCSTLSHSHHLPIIARQFRLNIMHHNQVHAQRLNQYTTHSMLLSLQPVAPTSTQKTMNMTAIYMYNHHLPTRASNPHTSTIVTSPSPAPSPLPSSLDPHHRPLARPGNGFLPASECVRSGSRNGRESLALVAVSVFVCGAAVTFAVVAAVVLLNGVVGGTPADVGVMCPGIAV